MNNRYFILLLWIVYLPTFAQVNYTLSGKILDNETSEPLADATIFLSELGFGTVSDEKGLFQIKKIPEGVYHLEISFVGKSQLTQEITIGKNIYNLIIKLKDLDQTIERITVKGKNENIYGISRLNSVDQMAIYASKKNELINLDQLTVNKAANTSRQIYAKISGLNIWESDGAGVQLGLGGRGLSPNRNSNFNTRQNGYDISADALGYPESYYTPPVEAIDQIEIVRGAASLQYGTQFGGLVNFVFKQATDGIPLQIHSRQSIGSFGFFNTFNSISGDLNKIKYYAFHQFKKSDGWRPNSNLKQHTAFFSLSYQINDRIKIRPEFTHTHYLAQQPGGLTDAQFAANPRQSFRSRNWFAVDWNLIAVNIDVKFKDHLNVNNRSFGLLASRDALGNLQNIQLQDFGEKRDFLHDQFKNWGNETRLLWQYNRSYLPSSLLVGMRYYQGNTHRQQGLGDSSNQPHFRYLNPVNLEGSDFILPSQNLAFFAENLFNINSKWSITPGIRYEWIRTATDGYYRNLIYDLAGNILTDEKIHEEKSHARNLVLVGIGSSYKPNNKVELYTNFSQNYRAINFNDIRVNVGNLVVDENLRDEKGYNWDLGLRGSNNKLDFDISLFYLAYKDRIGTILKKEPNPVFNNLTYRIIRFRSNLADAHIFGVESLLQYHLIGDHKSMQDKLHLSLFANVALTQARYSAPEQEELDNNQVELVPPFNLKTGIELHFGQLQFYSQYSFTSRQYSDASNAISTPSAIEGIIPSYQVIDLSFRYQWRKLELESGINNVMNQYYFTRRATGYPGPGIIPSDGRSFYLTMGVKI